LWRLLTVFVQEEFAGAGEAEDDDDAIVLPEPSRDVYDPPEEPMQVKLEWRLINNGEGR
jgi:hypothetical protein